uniref:Deoxyribose-phosphate aldolase n=1 Tax=Mycoplasmoides pirum TaxID=2122 RepID=DEOC_MYCPI|nr:RecName: Full=Deoxyribose-phosphate aldolase; Short=DERA; AltName: Full=2-deoxy-D-ribose 5-phosphate aldolase; AltName: Full=Phosphodeoxyriboaldolase; Short=Deoxyriboaldolase [Mycoplasmoides pirum]AAA25431.1 deoxyriboaldolase [Mycoplasmoides pirum]
MNYNSLFDHTLLRADASVEEIKQLCDEAVKFNFFSVCVNPSYVPYVKEQLHNSSVKICTVVGFPLGQTSTKQKVYETKIAIKEGADEIDMVLNISEFKENCACVVNEIRKYKKVCKKKILKVIVETALLSENEIEKATLVVIDGGADFIKTSTGFSSRGASIKDIEIMKNVIEKNNSKLKIKASGGIKTLTFVEELIKAGAERIGSSKSVEIIKETLNKN